MLLELIVSKNDVHDPKWLQNNSIEFQLWDSEYMIILNNYDSKFIKYINKWLENDTEKKFSEIVTKNRFNIYNWMLIIRNKKVSIPESLESIDLIYWKYRVTPKNSVTDHERISWDYK